MLALPWEFTAEWPEFVRVWAPLPRVKAARGAQSQPRSRAMRAAACLFPAPSFAVAAER